MTGRMSESVMKSPCMVSAVEAANGSGKLRLSFSHSSTPHIEVSFGDIRGRAELCTHRFCLCFKLEGLKES
jgi:hypothetical protein